MTLDPIRLSRRDAAAASLAVLLLAACKPSLADPTAPPANTADPPAPPLADLELPDPTPQARALGAATTAFGVGMLRQLMLDTPQATLVTSPLSLAADMLMLGQGARGATADVLTQALKLTPGLTLATAAQGFSNLAARLVSSAAATVNIADGLWADPAAGFEPAFLKALQDQFAAKATVTDLAQPAVLADINGFVSDTTHGKIPTILGALPAHALLVLVNALYFKAGWQRPFDAAETKPAPFTAASGAAAPAQLMHQRGRFQYKETDTLQALTLPYADPRFELRLVLAKPGAPADAWTQGFSLYEDYAEGEVFLPRLDLTWGADLTGLLAQIGLGPALASSADYSGATKAQIGGFMVVQKCVLKVDEQGAEAAAATAVIMVGAAAPLRPPPTPFVFRADRPFHLMLAEKATGAPLILAYVATPA